MREWSTRRQMRWARDAYYYGATEYALDILMEIAQEKINDYVQETFDEDCQPRPQKKSKVRPRKFKPSLHQGPEWDVLDE